MTLARFNAPQHQYFKLAVTELKAQKKRSHWMWFMFPQLRDLGKSQTAYLYGIADLNEAKAFLADPYLGNNLRQLCEVLLQVPTNDAKMIFGFPDDLKLKSSMTLFAKASNEPIFQAVLDKFFHGKYDQKTLELLKNM
ncbi:DUF1810 family protein [Ligilactobacillus murinus]|uniref:DUF1810 domain-containing protein n=1 Tax=Ligilactobacillus murinus TaxID=1622 RepID=UPI0010718BE2|nr:DUF1810 domain-containing protein [Ligilactobacillus murinus]MBF0759165.1 DUF1810 domain-containing protein [Ligilactobacillus murinus]MBF0832895.1 DUF1810 domain-containing protein [Ligilactobacillus murinus]TFU62758.1 DUF1810 family protein [Ligilactobacillus murinus]